MTAKLKLQRDYSIDILRCIALLGIICIHVQPTSVFIQQVRSFDVPMMVFLSGVVFSMSTNHHPIDYRKYIVKRFVRLILPTWIFLSAYFVLRYLLHPGTLPFGINFFFLLTGWYVWIIRVFFIIALFAPLVVTVGEKQSNVALFILIVLGLIINEFIAIFIHSTDNESLVVMLVMNLGYFLVFILGVGMKKISTNQLNVIIILAIISYGIIATYLYIQNSHYVQTNDYKYPPRFYYLSYALIIILLLYKYRDILLKISQKIHVFKCFRFIGSHTIWIYFYHIPIVEYLVPRNLPASWVYRYMIVLAIAGFFTYIQSYVVNSLAEKLKNKKISYYLKVLLVG